MNGDDESPLYNHDNGFKNGQIPQISFGSSLELTFGSSSSISAINMCFIASAKVAKGKLDSGFAIVRSPGHHAKSSNKLELSRFLVKYTVTIELVQLPKKPNLSFLKIKIFDGPATTVRPSLSLSLFVGIQTVLVTTHDLDSSHSLISVSPIARYIQDKPNLSDVIEIDAITDDNLTIENTD
ncbi:Histone deacetylase domain superfamily [Forsythia ovata]|uniref:Histone deacetylase domain superfamily n=1 Tax=Forsythia ovata TaxID=205694 RepID=A0ABD1XA07_9LAMI